MATIVNDIHLTDDFDLRINNGDLVVDDADEQHLGLILLLEPGQLAYRPLVGLGVSKLLLSPLTAPQKDKTRREAFIQLEMDGYNTGTAEIEFNNDITIKADR